MLTYLTTSLLTSNAQTVVNTVNTVGVMGKGIAAEFKKRYPEMFKRYRDLCREGQFHVGQLWLWKGPDQWVLNFPTKEHWRNPSKLEWIRAGLEKLALQLDTRGITEIAFPRLGCGNGGLDWRDVRPLMERYLADLPISVYIHDYEENIGLPEHKETGREEFLRSFDVFVSVLRTTIEKRNHLFHTLDSGLPFQVFLQEDDEIRIERPNSQALTGISKDELFELWACLLQGPVTQDKLTGRSWEEAEYVLPLISTLPFVRPLEVRRRGKTQRIGIELIGRRSPASLAGEPCQQSLEWRSLQP